MADRLCIAVVQQKFDRSPAENMEKGLFAMERAKKMGADLALFPECFITGYHLPISMEEALDREDPLIQTLCRKAASLEMGLVATAFTKGHRRPRNTAFLIDKTGQILMEYSKVHTCDFSLEACLESGEAFCVCDFHGVKLGLMICYDREYPESARVLMLKGAEIILVPNDCGSMRHRLAALSTRAYENMTGVVMANPPGENAGRSCAFSPIIWDEAGRDQDNAIFIADERSEDIYLADFDLKALRLYRSKEMMGNTFRKVYAYKDLLDPAVRPPFIR